MCVFIPIFRLQRIQLSDTIRCIKSCQPNDVACVLDPTHSLSHTFISLPTFREFLKPEGRYQSVLEPHNICKIHCSWILEVTHTNMIVRLPPTSLFPSLLLFFITLNLLSAYHIHFPAVVIISLTGFDNLPPPTPNYLFHDAFGWPTQVLSYRDPSCSNNHMQTLAGI